MISSVQIYISILSFNLRQFYDIVFVHIAANISGFMFRLSGLKLKAPHASISEVDTALGPFNASTL